MNKMTKLTRGTVMAKIETISGKTFPVTLKIKKADHFVWGVLKSGWAYTDGSITTYYPAHDIKKVIVYGNVCNRRWM